MKKNRQSWRHKAVGVWQVCETELKKTTAIGLKMISASKANGELNEAFEDLGRHLYQSLKTGRHEWHDSKVKMLCQRIQELDHFMHTMEDQVQLLKKDKDSKDKT
jgi:hypothetical protein